MKRKSFNRNAVLAAVMLGISSLSLTGCGQKTSEEHMLAARQFVEAKDNPSAIIEYKSAIQKDPEDPNARFELGQLYLQQKDFAAAEKELNRALDLGYEVSEVLPLRLTTINRQYANFFREAGIGLKCLGYLNSQLPRRGKYQQLRIVAFDVQIGQHGQRESCRFTGTGLRLTQQIVSVQ